MKNAINASLPEELDQRLKAIILLGPQTSGDNFFSKKRRTTLRVNTIKTTAEVFLKQMKELGVVLEQVPWYEKAFILKNENQRQDLFHSAPNDSGDFYVQGLSSMIPPLVLDPRPDDKLLDIAASPGSKTTQLSVQMNNTGEILANDISQDRLFKLKRNLDAQGAINVKLNRSLGETLWRRYPEYFDKTLADAPCSMEGRISLLDPRTFRNWSLKKIKALSKRQKWILRSAVSATKPGGTIVYSTCTLAPEENEEVIDWLLNKEADAIKLESISIPNLKLMPGITSWQGKKYNPEIRKTARILPSELMEGFFVAKIRKLRSTVNF